MAVNYCGRQLAQTMGCVASAYHKKEGAALHPGVCKFSLQYGGIPDEHFGVRVGMWNLCGLSGKEAEICGELRLRMIDVCCL